jgi:predicted RNase H-like nuclease (RuvC/YqgF family)
LERDAAEREAREKETRVLSLTRDLDGFMEKVEELERSKRQLQAELDELVNNQGTADKNVSIYIINQFFLCLIHKQGSFTRKCH